MDIQPAFDLAYYNIEPKFKRCGCFVRNLSVLENAKPNTHVAIPLKHIDYDIQVTNGLVSTTLQQKYINPTKKYLEIDFSFPIDPKACIYKFVAEFGNKRIEGIVKEKEEAKKEYKQAVQQGKQAVYAQIDQNSKDIINMQIGNLGPGEQVKISISYLQQLTVEQNTFYQLHIPSTISPRYMNDTPGRRFVQNTKVIQGEYTWTFKITLLTSRKLAYYISHSHNLQLISQNQEKTETILCLAKEEKPNVDLSLLFTVEDFHLPNYVLGRTDISSTAMLSFIPKFCELSLDDAMKASMIKKQLETDMSAAKGEYIFLLDRSGSMGGKRIEKAKQALILFLQSLPEDTYFNVVSFGSGSNFMFNQSTKYEKNSLQNAVSKIKTMGADMGGTEIYNPLLQILQTKVIDGYPKQIFLLTDGGVSNTEGVINLVGKEVKYSRCHSIGVGNGCSQALIKGCAQKGKGKFIFITDQENPSQKIIGLLEETLTPVIDHVTLKYDKNLVESIVPNPESLPYILKNELVNFYITFKGQLDKHTQFTFGYKDSMNKLPFETKIEVNPESQNMPFVDKMAHNKIIKNLQIAAKENKPIEEYMYYVKVVDKKKQAIDHSVKHQILSEYTAFICVNKEMVDGKFQQIKDIGSQKVKIQPIIPQDYAMDQQLQGLRMKTSSLASSSMNFALGNKSSMAKTRSSNQMVDLSSKMSSKSSNSQGLFTNVVSSVTNFFKGSPPPAISMPQQQRMQLQRNQMNNLTEKRARLQAEKQKCLRREKCQMKSSLPQYEDAFYLEKMSEDQEEEDDSRGIEKCQVYEETDFDTEKSVKKKNKKKSRNEQTQIKEAKNIPDSESISNVKAQTVTIDDVIKQQNVDGSFLSQDLLKRLFPLNFMTILSEGEGKKISAALIISYVVAKWIEKHNPEKQYALIIKKAYSFIKKSLKMEELQFLDILLN